MSVRSGGGLGGVRLVLTIAETMATGHMAGRHRAYPWVVLVAILALGAVPWATTPPGASFPSGALNASTTGEPVVAATPPARGILDGAQPAQLSGPLGALPKLSSAGELAATPMEGAVGLGSTYRGEPAGSDVPYASPRPGTSAVSSAPPPVLDGSGNAGTSRPNPKSLTVSLTTSSPNDLLVLGLTADNEETPLPASRISDSFGRSWLEEGSPLQFLTEGGGSPGYLYVFYATTGGRAGTDYITANFAGHDNGVKTATAIAFGLSGVAASNPWDGAGAQEKSGTGAQSASESINTTNPNDAVVAFLAVTTRETVTPSTGFTPVATLASNPPDFTSYAEYERAMSTGEYTSFPSWNGGQTYGIVVAAVKGSAASAPSTVTFASTGLPNGTTWGVTFGTTHQNNTTANGAGTISFSAQPGTYPYTVSGAPGFSASPSGGSLTVTGSDAVVNITWTARAYSVTFIESGLPSRTPWSATLGSTTSHSTGPTITFFVGNGTYPWSIPRVPDYIGSPGSGTASVAGSNVTQPVVFVAGLLGTYFASFVETGLPVGASWAVTFDGVTTGGTGTMISFLATNGTHAYSIGPVAGFAPDAPNATLTLNGANRVVVVSFRSLTNDAGSGLPFGLSPLDWVGAGLAFGGIGALAVAWSRSRPSFAPTRAR